MKNIMRKFLSIALATSVVMTCFTAAAFAAANPVGVSYSAHVQDIGWQAAVTDGATAGTAGRSLRLEALKVNLTNAPAEAHINYQVHVQDYGWITSARDGALAGTTGESKRVEAIAMTISGVAGYTIQYRVHVQDIGWMNWVSDGSIAGTVGQNKRIEAIQIRLATAVNSIFSIAPAMTLTAGGATGTLTAMVDPASEVNNIIWSSDNTSVATVANGVVTPVAAGTARITASVGGKTATCLVTVTNGGSIEAPVTVSAIAVSGEGNAVTVVNGGTLQMSAGITPSNAVNKQVTWSTINGTGSAVIDAAGLLSATGVGTVTVKAANAASGVIGTKDITVTAPADTTAPTATAAQSGQTITYTFSEPVQLVKQDTHAVAALDKSLLGIYTIDADGNYGPAAVSGVTITSAALVENVLTITYTGSLVNQTTTRYVVDAWGYSITDLAGNKIAKDQPEQVFTVIGVDPSPADSTSGIINQSQGVPGSKRVTLTITVNTAAGVTISDLTAADFTIIVKSASVVVSSGSFNESPFSDFANHGNGIYSVTYTGAGNYTHYELCNLTADNVEIENLTGVNTPPAADPILQSAFVSLDGTNIVLAFDKAMHIPTDSVSLAEALTLFKVVADGQNRTCSDAVLSADKTKIILTISGSPVLKDAAVTLTYHGGYVQSTDLGFMSWLTDYPIINNSIIEAPVTVSAIAVSGEGNAVTVVNGGTLQMSAGITPSNAVNKQVTWSTINGTGSAVIDAAGLLSATGVGTVTVKATNTASGVIGTKDITVTAPADTTAPTATASLDGQTITYTFSEPVQLVKQDTHAVAALDKSLLDIYTIDADGNYGPAAVSGVTITSAALVGNVLTITYTGSLVNQTTTRYVVDAWGYSITDLAGNEIAKDQPEQVFTVIGVDTTPADSTSGITNQTQGVPGSKRVTLTITVKNAAGDNISDLAAADFTIIVKSVFVVVSSGSFNELPFSDFANNGNGIYTIVYTGAGNYTHYDLCNLTADNVEIENLTGVNTPPAADPILQSANVSLDGTNIVLAFDKAMHIPTDSVSLAEALTLFKVVADGQNRTCSDAVLSADKTMIILTLSGSPVLTDAAVTLTYHGGYVQSTDLGFMSWLTDYPIINNSIVEAPSTAATVTSTIGTVNNITDTIVDIPYSTTLANFKAAITPAAGATFEVYQSNGTTLATDLASSYKVIVTAQDTTTTKTYTVTVMPSAPAPLPNW